MAKPDFYDWSDFQPGDRIFDEDFAVAGPGHKTDPVCINCLAIINYG